MKTVLVACGAAVATSTAVSYTHLFIDALKVIDRDEMSIELTTSVGPAVIVPADGSDEFIYLILPVRIAEEA